MKNWSMKAVRLYWVLFLSTEKIDLCFFFAASVIFLTADSISEGLVFITRNHASPLSANTIVWVCLTILWGWRLKG